VFGGVQVPAVMIDIFSVEAQSLNVSHICSFVTDIKIVAMVPTKHSVVFTANYLINLYFNVPNSNQGPNYKNILQ